MGSKSRNSKTEKSKQHLKRRKADATTRAELDVRLHATEARISAIHTRIDQTVAILEDVTARLAAIVALLDDLPSRTSSDAARELRQPLEQMLVAQRRTNELLDLALGVAIDDDHGGRPGG